MNPVIIDNEPESNENKPIWSNWKLWLAVSFTAVIFYLAWIYASWIVAFPGGLLSSIILVKFVHWVDNKGMGKVSTYSQIVTQKNIAYAIYFMGICIVAAIGYLAPFLAFVLLR